MVEIFENSNFFELKLNNGLIYYKTELEKIT